MVPMERVAELHEWGWRPGSRGTTSPGARGDAPSAAEEGWALAQRRRRRGSSRAASVAPEAPREPALAAPAAVSWTLPGRSVEVPCPVESIHHLIQDDATVTRIHGEEVPPECYYVELRKQLAKIHPAASAALLDHVVALTAAFDVATGFALSFGISKFQLAQQTVKLVGELVGTFGRRPNPDLIKAIKAWPAIRDLKDLQSFLGTTNYVRPHAGPAYARVMAPLRVQLKADAVWPLNAEQLKAVEGLKGLFGGNPHAGRSGRGRRDPGCCGAARRRAPRRSPV